MIRIDHYHHIVQSADTERFQRLVIGKLDSILTKLEVMMPTLDEVLADVQAESTQIDSLATLTAGIKQQLIDALAGTVLPPEVQAKVDAVWAGVEANKAKVVDAINANT